MNQPVTRRAEIPTAVLSQIRGDVRALSGIAASIENIELGEAMLIDEFLALLPTYVRGQTDWADTALYHILLNLLSSSRELGIGVFSIDTWSTRLAPHIKQACSVVILAFFNEALEAYRTDCATFGSVWLEKYFPVTPEGGEYTPQSATMFRRFLEVYCIARVAEGFTDPLSDCWNRMSFRFRESPYVDEFCKNFRLPSPGDKLDKYTIELPVGIGGMAVIYRAMHRDKHRVALKMMRPDCGHRDLFAFEASSTVELTDRRFVFVKDSDVDNEAPNPFFTMSYVEGGKSLSDVFDFPHENVELVSAIAKRLQLKHPGALYDRRVPDAFEGRHRSRLCDRFIAAMVAEVARAVDYLHHCHEDGSGYVHCDIKPANILACRLQGLLLSDLGLCRPCDSKGRSDRGNFAGTISYSSPEQAAEEPMSIRSDVFQLGALIYRAVAGSAPFRGSLSGETDEHALRRIAATKIDAITSDGPRANAKLEAICVKAMSHDPLLRYESALGMAEDLDRFICGEPVRALPGYQFRTLQYKTLRSKIAWVGLAMLCLSAHFGYQEWLGFHENWLNSSLISDPLAHACENRYRTMKVVPPPPLKLDPKLNWPDPSYDNVIVLHSSSLVDLSHWCPVPSELVEKQRIEPALFTRVIQLRKKLGPNDQNKPFKVVFQYRTVGFEVDLTCPSHHFEVSGSEKRVSFDDHYVLVREIAVDISHDNQDTVTIVIQGTIWNGFQLDPKTHTQRVGFLSPSPYGLQEGSMAVLFPHGKKPLSKPRAYGREFGDNGKREELPLNASAFLNSSGTDWWLWRPEKPQTNHYYMLEFSWPPNAPGSPTL